MARYDNLISIKILKRFYEFRKVKKSSQILLQKFFSTKITFFLSQLLHYHVRENLNKAKIRQILVLLTPYDESGRFLTTTLAKSLLSPWYC